MIGAEDSQDVVGGAANFLLFHQARKGADQVGRLLLLEQEIRHVRHGGVRAVSGAALGPQAASTRASKSTQARRDTIQDARAGAPIRSIASTMRSQKRSTSSLVATWAFVGPKRPEKSVTVMPELNSPRVSTATKASTQCMTVGSITRATAHGSWTGGESKPELRRYVSRKNSMSCTATRETGVPRPEIRWRTAGVASAWCVRSRPTIVSGQPAMKTIAAASGST